MIVKLLTERHLEFLSLKGTAERRLSLHMSKCHIVGNHMTRLIFERMSLSQQKIWMHVVAQTGNNIMLRLSNHEIVSTPFVST